jgi:hypothetical protein
MRRTNRRGTAPPSTSPAEMEDDVYSEIFSVLSSEGEEEEDEQSNVNITLEDLKKCALDSESQAAKKFGCGTTRFKTM